MAIIVIPARYAASRLPGKLLKRAGGKTILQWTWEAAKRCKRAREVYIATGDWSILQAAEAFGAKVVHTQEDHDSGSSRLAEAHRLIRHKAAEPIVNVQGDEPDLDPDAVDRLIFEMEDDGTEEVAKCMVGTLCAPLRASESGSPSVVKVAVAAGRALYFSRAPLAGAMRHVGVYCYQPEALHALREYVRAAGRSALSKAEDLEQLFYIEHRWNFLAVECQSWPAGIDTAADFEQFKARRESQ